MRIEGLEARPGVPDPEVPVELVQTQLNVLRRRLGLDTAWLSSFRDDVQRFEVFDGDPAALDLTCGDEVPLAGSYCVRVIDGRLPAAVPDTAANPTTAALPVTGELGLGSYVGAPVRGADGTTWGMVCAVSQQARADLADVDLRIVERVAELVGLLLESPNRDAGGADQQRSAIRRVVAERDFEVVFQGVHDVDTGKAVGVEALARFPCEPFRPDAFFEQAASLGLDIELETEILRRVLSMVPKLPSDVFVAVNISPSAVLLAPWAELLADVDPARIVLEITEHDAVQNYAALEDALELSRVRGMRVAVDDVGAGFSSFSHVLELAPEFVKIDQSIIRHVDSDNARRRLARAIAEFARQIGATAIAEGVETQGELDAIKAAGISWAQGYHLGRPQPHEHGFASANISETPGAPTPVEFDVLGERRFELVLAHSPIGMAVVGLDGTFLRTNRTLRAILGYNRLEMANLKFQDITHPDDLDLDLEQLAACLDGRRRSYRVDKRYIAADGRIVWAAVTAALVCAPHDRPHCFVSQIVDVTADRLREADALRQTATDPLTAIANRSAAWGRLEQLDASDTGYGVLVCDIERFASVDRGHHTSDHVLLAVAKRLLAVLGPDDLLARWGGDEFLVVTSRVGERNLALLAQRIRSQLYDAPITLPDDTQVAVAVTIGFAARHPGDGQSIDAVLELADHAMNERRRHASTARRHCARRGPALR